MFQTMRNILTPGRNTGGTPNSPRNKSTSEPSAASTLSPLSEENIEEGFDILSATSDAAAMLSNNEIEELAKESEQMGNNSKEEEEKKTILNNFMNLFTTNSQANYLKQITLGIGAAAGESAKEKNLKEQKADERYTHKMHLFDFGVSINVKEYCPQIFRSLREDLFGITLEDYVKEWTLPDELLNASEGAGRSGALFCKSVNKKYIMKTIFASEVASLLGMLKSYYKHCRRSPHTLIMRLIGLYRFSRPIPFSSEVFVLVFGNISWSGSPDGLQIDEVYDLKGRRTKVISPSFFLEQLLLSFSFLSPFLLLLLPHLLLLSSFSLCFSFPNYSFPFASSFSSS